MSAHPAILVRRPGPRPRVVTGYTDAQTERARLLISDGGLVPHPHPGVWLVCSDDGERFYLTSPNGCTCPAGLHGVHCYHSAAAAVIAAGNPRNTARRHYRQGMRNVAQIANAAATLPPANGKPE